MLIMKVILWHKIMQHGKVEFQCFLAPVFFNLKVKLVNILYILFKALSILIRTFFAIELINYRNYFYGKLENFAETAET